MSAVSENGINEDYIRTTLDKGLLNLSGEELQALKSHLEEHGIRVYNSLPPELWVLIPIYSKAFLETLARRHADGVADLLRKRFRKNGATTECQISIDSDASATVAVTGDLPDEARLALLDLDVTADEVRGKLLRWDGNTSAWRADH